MSKITTTQVLPWVKAESDKLSSSTLELCYRFLASIFLAAVADRVIARSP